MINSLEGAIELLKEGNVDALGYIYNETRKGVFTFVLPMLRDYYKAEDITEQTFVQVYEKIKQFNDGNFRNWILTIAKNLTLNEIERLKKEQSVDFQESQMSNLVYVNSKKEFDTPTIDLANKILSPTDFQIVMMHVIGEYKHREISEILDIPLGTITWKYNQALNKLKKELDKKRS